MMDLKSYLNKIDWVNIPTINYRQNIYLGISIINFSSMAMGLLMTSAPWWDGWIDYEFPTLGTAYMLSAYVNIL